MALIDPSLITALGFLFNKTVTIQESTPTQDATGQPIDAWSDKSGHVAIPCVMSPATRVAMPDEKKLPTQIVAKSTWKVMLQGNYPAITTAMRAVVASVAYDIVGAQTDSQDLVTSLLVQLVE